MTDIEMLPLPEWTKRDDAGQNMVPSEIRVSMADYASAVAQHNVAARDAEIEALRAERDSFQRVGIAAQDRADRLAEALRIAEATLADIGDADREPGDDVAWCERRAALGLRRVRDTLRDHDQEGRNG